MWAMTHFSKWSIVLQLTMSDSSEIDETAIMNLSNVEGLEWFENILFIGSFQDNYSLPESSLIQITPRIFNHKHYFSCKNLIVVFIFLKRLLSIIRAYIITKRVLNLFIK